MSEDKSPHLDNDQMAMTRRKVLQGAPEGKPVPGGVLRVGPQGGSDTDTLDAHNALTDADFARTAC